MLLPLWRRIRPFVNGTWRMRPVPGQQVVAVGPSPVGITSERPIRPINRDEFDAMARVFPYYKDRWGYTAVACGEVGALIDRHGLRTALELGPHLRSVVVGADVIDRKTPAGIEVEGRVIVHDARRFPWPIEDAHYDLFVALQVFEHLQERQAAAFREVRRIARHAVISLPIDWEMDDPNDCHHRISNERALGWFAPVVPSRIVENRTEGRKRVVYVFENLQRPAAE